MPSNVPRDGGSSRRKRGARRERERERSSDRYKYTKSTTEETTTTRTFGPAVMVPELGWAGAAMGYTPVQRRKAWSNASVAFSTDSNSVLIDAGVAEAVSVTPGEKTRSLGPLFIRLTEENLVLQPMPQSDSQSELAAVRLAVSSDIAAVSQDVEDPRVIHVDRTRSEGRVSLRCASGRKAAGWVSAIHTAMETAKLGVSM